MRIAELSRRAGVPVPTIKFYLREGLIPAGERTSPNQAQYDESHLSRLRLIRTLVDVGGLSVASARQVITKMNTPGLTVLESLGKAQFAMTTNREPVEDEAWFNALAQVDELIEQRGWQVRPTNPAKQTLAGVLATLNRLGKTEPLTLLDDYAAAAETIATSDAKLLLQGDDVDGMAEALVVWTALGDVVLSAMRRLAQEAVATPMLAGETPKEPAAESGTGESGTESPAR